ncbi:hypothetical protein [Flavobacterium aquidurense]|uniref:hypothetical protein n=1 Tax=Flavobacterium aquidurense TaxID=362413 RepID=UPI00285796C5|nr:hypothetical protein [Flavobacterium aquidurense]MDR7370173.1 hypothetical protein [Flavobacterium aquidurense]
MKTIFNSGNLENFGETLESKVSGISANTFMGAAAGSLLLAATLKLAGQNQAGSFLGKWAFPLLAIGCYKKFSNSSLFNDKKQERYETKDQNEST